MQKRPFWPLLLMIVWFSAIGLLSLVAAFFGLAFSNEPGGRGNPGLVEYTFIFAPLAGTVLLGTVAVISWQKGKSGVALICCAVSLLAGFAFLTRFGM